MSIDVESTVSKPDDAAQTSVVPTSDSDSDLSDTDAASQATPTEWLATGRERRSTAGNRMKTLLANEEPDSDLELLFAEDEDDEGFSDNGGDGSDVRMDSSSDDEDQENAGDDLEGEQELERQARERRTAQRKRKAQDAIPAKFRKKVRTGSTTTTKLDSSTPSSTTPAPSTPAPRPKKKSERVSWLPSATDMPTRASSRSTTRMSKEQLHQQMEEREARRLRQLALIQKKAERMAALKKPPMTQEDRLREARAVEERNGKSLNRWEEAERQREEEQRAKLAALNERTLKGPVLTFWSGRGRWVGGGRPMLVEEKPKRKREKPEKAKDKEKGKGRGKEGSEGRDATKSFVDPALSAKNEVNGPETKETGTKQPEATTADGQARPESAQATAGNDEKDAGSEVTKPKFNEAQATPLGDTPNQQPMPEDGTSTPNQPPIPGDATNKPAKPDTMTRLPSSAATIPSSRTTVDPDAMDIDPTSSIAESSRAAAIAPAVVNPPAETKILASQAPSQPTTGDASVANQKAEPTSPSADRPQALQAAAGSGPAPSESKASVANDTKAPGPVPSTVTPQPIVATQDSQTGTTRCDVPHKENVAENPSAGQAGEAAPAELEEWKNAIIYQNFDENVIRDKAIQTGILFGRKMTKLSKPTPAPNCIITGLPGRYRDPELGLPYHSARAFRELKRLRSGEYNFSGLLGAWVGSGAIAARGVPERFLNRDGKRSTTPAVKKEEKKVGAPSAAPNDDGAVKPDAVVGGPTKAAPQESANVDVPTVAPQVKTEDGKAEDKTATPKPPQRPLAVEAAQPSAQPTDSNTAPT